MLESILLQIFQAKTVKAVLSSFILIMSYLIGSFDVTLQAMFLAVVLDFLLGLGYACFHGEVDKLKFRKGLYKVMMYMIALVLGHVTDILVFHTEMEFGFQNFIIVYLGITEILSCFQHLAKMGFKIPKKIIMRLEGYRDDLSITK